MEYVQFGNTGMKVSRFALGAMTFGAGLDEAASRRVVDEAIDNGVNMIDTADSYGESEEILGRIIDPQKRDRVYLATKVFRRFCRDGRIGKNCRTNIINSLERSLRLMKTDYVDLYQLHHPDSETPLGETLMALDTLVRQGKIRYVGVSNHYAWQMSYMIGVARERGLETIVSYQANYNILDRQLERDALGFLQRFNIAMMCYGPLCGGVLTGKYHSGEEIDPNARGMKLEVLRKNYVENETVIKIMAELRSIAEEQGLRINQLALLWLKAKPHATTILLGGSKPEHFTKDYEIADRSLPADVVARIDEISEPRIYTPYRNQPCREGAQLPPTR